jgi:RNA polymerase sigma factor (sigma-70 family)
LGHGEPEPPQARLWGANGARGVVVGVGASAVVDTSEAERRRAALGLLRSHEPLLRRTARRVSLCPDDADDACQRAVEIVLTKAPTLEHPRLVAWACVVTRREALAVRRSRERLLAGATADGAEAALERMPSERPGAVELAERRERAVASLRALATLKPDERRAIVLQASGYSYLEICSLTGWTYTKVNRCLAEGRAKLRSAEPSSSR